MDSHWLWAISLNLFLFATFLADSADAQLDCAAAPTSALKIVCEQLHRWDKNARVSQKEGDI
jgi:hypothetical protein